MRTTRIRGLVATLVVGLLAGSRFEAPEPEVESVAAPPLRLVLNLSARRLYVYEHGERTHSYTVAVGQPGHRTPTGNFRITRVVWNPWWRPPDRAWARGERPTPPGPNNPMGRVKMYFRDLYYIHGTPHTGTLGRAVSHGCVRMSNANAIALARLVHKYGSPGVSEETIDRLVAHSSRTRTIWLERPIPLEVVWGSAAVPDGSAGRYAVAGVPGSSS
ncbi:MAG TPA: L,D-transpeptidase [Longimicrobiales bacterium]